MKYYCLNDDIGFVELMQSVGDDLSVVNSARTSHGDKSDTINDKDKKLIRLLLERKHETPLEHNSMTFFVKCPLFVARQWCLSGDTLIHFVNGRESEYKRQVSVRDLHKRFHGGNRRRQQVTQRKVLKYNPESESIETTHIKDIWETGVKLVYKVETENGGWIKITDDHPLLTKKGWRELREIATLPTKDNSNWSVSEQILSITKKQSKRHMAFEQNIIDESNLKIGDAKDNHDDSVKHGTASIPRRMHYWADIANIELIGEEMTYDIEVSDADHNFVAGGIVVHNCRHRIGASINEISARYALTPDEIYIPKEFRIASKSNRQVSELDGLDTIDQGSSRKIYAKSTTEAFEAYHQLLANGVAREQARAVLPLASYTQFYWTCNLRSLLHFINLRDHPDAQWEIQQYARNMLEQAKELFPETIDAYMGLQREHTV